MGSPSEADVPEWAAMLSTPRRALLAAMEMDTKVQGQKAAAASTPSWRAPDKLAAALARDDSPLKDGVVDEAEVATALNNLALLLEEQGDVESAKAMGKRALAIVLKTRGPNHPDTKDYQRTWG